MKHPQFNFEVHVTVAAGTDADALARVAAEAKAKVGEIVLARGATPHQPMITYRETGTRKELARRTAKLTARLPKEGIEVVRVKVELTLDEGFFETTDGERYVRSGGAPDWLYAEQHLRVRLLSTDGDRLESESVRLGAHVSSSARSSSGHMEERFVTSRVNNTPANFPPHEPEPIDRWSPRDFRTLSGRFDAVAAGLREAGWGIVSADRELVVEDTNFELDAGWLPEATAEVETAAWGSQAPSWWPASWTLPADSKLEQARLFDPSMTHLSRAFRRGDPGGPGSEAWLSKRTAIFDAILSAVAGSDLRRSLCVRGSVLLRDYLGAASRTPGDIDWVVLPVTTKIDDDTGVGLIAAMRKLLSDVEVDGAELHVDDAVPDAIWAYDRVPGRRLTVPWSSEEVGSGTIQMDFVFGEELWTEPVRVHVDERTGQFLLAASPELSLASKLMWLATDAHPQGKDLYDAVLLAESYEVSSDLVERAFTEEREWAAAQGVEARDGRSIIEALWLNPTEWDDLVAEYPGIQGDPARWQARLADALFPAGR